MDLGRRIERLRSESMDQIGHLASEGQTDGVLAKSKSLSRIEDLREQYLRLVDAVERLERGDSDVATTNMAPSRAEKGAKASGRALGQMRRAELIESGSITLRAHAGVVYQSESGSRVGVPFATERQEDRWFLGLPDGAFDEAILLLETTDGCLNVCLPRAFFVRYGGDLSRSKGQVKFNVSRRDGGLELVVPGHPTISAERFVDAFASIGVPVDGKAV